MDPINHLASIILAHRAEFEKPGIISVREGYLMQDGWPTTTQAIVVVLSATATDIAFPAHLDGVPVDVRPATEAEQFAFDHPVLNAQLAEQHPELRTGAFAEPLKLGLDDETLSPDAEIAAAKPQLQYTAPDIPLEPVTGKIKITCHASPDAGWPTLKQFLAGTQSTLTIGLYDFTAKHILDAVDAALTGKKKLILTLDNPPKNPTADQTDSETISALSDSLGAEEFESAWALCRANSQIPRWIFPTAYHIKVAVRDSKTTWLSSGNWNNSNQPDFDPIDQPSDTDQKLAKKSDRDWHVVIDHEGLSQTYEAYLQHDFDTASQEAGGPSAPQSDGAELTMPDLLSAPPAAAFEFHAPLTIEEHMTITPLLTPDPGVYQPAMLKMIQSATQSLYIQLQYIHPSTKDDAADFTALLEAVAAKIDAGLDVRIILSQWQATGGWLERLQAAGINPNAVKIQNGVHNKGFVVDSKVVALGSQNWSSEGVLQNRDASVIIDNESAARYYEKIFLHDWERLAKKKAPKPTAAAPKTEE